MADSRLTETFRLLLDIKRESNTLEVARCTALLSAARLEEQIKALADEWVDERSLEDGVAEAVRLAAMRVEQMSLARDFSRKMEALKWRLVELETNSPYLTHCSPDPGVNEIN